MRTTAWRTGVLAMVLTLGAVQAPAATPPPTNQEPARADWQRLSPEERQLKLKEMRDKFEKLTPEQKEAQRKIWRERMVTRIAELKKKEKDKTITDKEAKDLERWEKRLKRWDQDRAPDRPLDKPPDKKRNSGM